jgi:hypothetical protein
MKGNAGLSTSYIELKKNTQTDYNTRTPESGELAFFYDNKKDHFTGKKGGGSGVARGFSSSAQNSESYADIRFFGLSTLKAVGVPFKDFTEFLANLVLELIELMFIVDKIGEDGEPIVHLVLPAVDGRVKLDIAKGLMSPKFVEQIEEWMTGITVNLPSLLGESCTKKTIADFLSNVNGPIGEKDVKDFVKEFSEEEDMRFYEFQSLVEITYGEEEDDKDEPYVGESVEVSEAEEEEGDDMEDDDEPPKLEPIRQRKKAQGDNVKRGVGFTEDEDDPRGGGGLTGLDFDPKHGKGKWFSLPGKIYAPILAPLFLLLLNFFYLTEIGSLVKLKDPCMIGATSTFEAEYDFVSAPDQDVYFSKSGKIVDEESAREFREMMNDQSLMPLVESTADLDSCGELIKEKDGDLATYNLKTRKCSVIESGVNFTVKEGVSISTELACICRDVLCLRLKRE